MTQNNYSFCKLPDSSRGVSKLIRLYRANECLWNPNSPGYHNAALKQRAWNRIAGIYDNTLSVDDVKSQVLALRDYYENERMAFASNNHHVPQYPYYLELQFMGNMEPRQMSKTDSLHSKINDLLANHSASPNKNTIFPASEIIKFMTTDVTNIHHKVMKPKTELPKSFVVPQLKEHFQAGITYSEHRSVSGNERFYPTEYCIDCRPKKKRNTSDYSLTPVKPKRKVGNKSNNPSFNSCCPCNNGANKSQPNQTKNNRKQDITSNIAQGCCCRSNSNSRQVNGSNKTQPNQTKSSRKQDTVPIAQIYCCASNSSSRQVNGSNKTQPNQSNNNRKQDLSNNGQICFCSSNSSSREVNGSNTTQPNQTKNNRKQDINSNIAQGCCCRTNSSRQFNGTNKMQVNQSKNNRKQDITNIGQICCCSSNSSSRQANDSNNTPPRQTKNNRKQDITNNMEQLCCCPSNSSSRQGNGSINIQPNQTKNNRKQDITNNIGQCCCCRSNSSRQVNGTNKPQPNQTKNTRKEDITNIGQICRCPSNSSSLQGNGSINIQPNQTKNNRKQDITNNIAQCCCCRSNSSRQVNGTNKAQQNQTKSSRKQDITNTAQICCCPSNSSSRQVNGSNKTQPNQTKNNRKQDIANIAQICCCPSNSSSRQVNGSNKTKNNRKQDITNNTQICCCSSNSSSQGNGSDKTMPIESKNNRKQDIINNIAQPPQRNNKCTCPNAMFGCCFCPKQPTLNQNYDESYFNNYGTNGIDHSDSNSCCPCTKDLEPEPELQTTRKFRFNEELNGQMRTSMEDRAPNSSFSSSLYANWPVPKVCNHLLDSAAVQEALSQESEYDPQNCYGGDKSCCGTQGNIHSMCKMRLQQNKSTRRYMSGDDRKSRRKRCIQNCSRSCNMISYSNDDDDDDEKYDNEYKTVGNQQPEDATLESTYKMDADNSQAEDNYRCEDDCPSSCNAFIIDQMHNPNNDKPETEQTAELNSRGEVICKNPFCETGINRTQCPRAKLSNSLKQMFSKYDKTKKRPSSYSENKPSPTTSHGLRSNKQSSQHIDIEAIQAPYEEKVDELHAKKSHKKADKKLFENVKRKEKSCCKHCKCSSMSESEQRQRAEKLGNAESRNCSCKVSVCPSENIEENYDNALSKQMYDNNYDDVRNDNEQRLETNVYADEDQQFGKSFNDNYPGEMPSKIDEAPKKLACSDCRCPTSNAERACTDCRCLETKPQNPLDEQRTQDYDQSPPIQPSNRQSYRSNKGSIMASPDIKSGQHSSMMVAPPNLSRETSRQMNPYEQSNIISEKTPSPEQMASRQSYRSNKERSTEISGSRSERHSRSEKYLRTDESPMKTGCSNCICLKAAERACTNCRCSKTSRATAHDQQASVILEKQPSPEQLVSRQSYRSNKENRISRPGSRSERYSSRQCQLDNNLTDPSKQPLLDSPNRSLIEINSTDAGRMNYSKSNGISSPNRQKQDSNMIGRSEVPSDKGNYRHTIDNEDEPTMKSRSKSNIKSYETDNVTLEPRSSRQKSSSSQRERSSSQKNSLSKNRYSNCTCEAACETELDMYLQDRSAPRRRSSSPRENSNDNRTSRSNRYKISCDETHRPCADTVCCCLPFGNEYFLGPSSPRSQKSNVSKSFSPRSPKSFQTDVVDMPEQHSSKNRYRSEPDAPTPRSSKRHSRSGTPSGAASPRRSEHYSQINAPYDNIVKTDEVPLKRSGCECLDYENFKCPGGRQRSGFETCPKAAQYKIYKENQLSKDFIASKRPRMPNAAYDYDPQNTDVSLLLHGPQKGSCSLCKKLVIGHYRPLLKPSNKSHEKHQLTKVSELFSERKSKILQSQKMFSNINFNASKREVIVLYPPSKNFRSSSMCIGKIDTMMQPTYSHPSKHQKPLVMQQRQIISEPPTKSNASAVSK